MMSRRKLLAGLGTVVAFRNETLDLVSKLVAKTSPDPVESAEDEEFWIQIQQAFQLDRNFVNFNNGGCSPSPRIVADSLRRQLEYANQAPSYYMWQHQEPEIENVRRRLAATFGCDTEEIAITRNASEALQTCLFGLELHAGDEVLTTTMDYPRMITTLQQRERRDGIKMVQVDPPAVPKSQRDLLDTIERGITPRTKLILFSHVSFYNGQIYPVHDICELGRRHGIPVIVDGAHAFAQFPFSQPQLGCEFYGTSLHKWLMAPIGTGFLYMKKANIPHVWPLMAAAETQTNDIRKYEEIGTHPAAVHNAIGEALTFHEMIGVERKAARLRALRSRWADKIRGEKNVAFHTNLDPANSCGLSNVEIKGIPPADLHAWLMSKHGIYTTVITHPQFSGLRVTPNVYSTQAEIDRFGAAMLHAAQKGIG